MALLESGPVIYLFRYLDERAMHAKSTRMKPRTNGRKAGRGGLRWAIAIGGGVLLLALAPRLALWSPVLNALVAQYGDLQPLRVEIGGGRGGWFAPLQLHDIRVLDGNGQLLGSVAEVATSKGVLGWALNSSDLGTLRVVRPEAVVVVEEGTSNLETALEPVLQRWASAPQEPQTMVRGTLEVEQARVLFVDAAARAPESRQWLVALESVQFGLPDANAPWGVLDGQMRVWAIQTKAGGLASAQPAGAAGTLAFRIEPADEGRVALRARLIQVPLDIYELLHRRLPDVGLDALQGRLSATVAGWYQDSGAWRFALSDVLAERLRCRSAAVLGAQGLSSDRLTLRIDAGVKENRIIVHQGQIACEFLETELSGRAPWPLNLPESPTTLPSDLELRAAGAVDIPQLVRAAPDALPLREGLAMERGKVSYRVDLHPDASGRPAISLQCSLPELAGRFGGQPLQWKDPLSLQVDVQSEKDRSYRAAVRAQSDFASLTAEGTQDAGTAQCTLDLDRFYGRISNWIELPFQQLSGTMKLDGTWASAGDQRLQTKIDLETTALEISTPAGQTILEPAWSGNLQTVCDFAEGAVAAIHSAKLEMVAADERFAFELSQPLAITGPQANGARAPFALDVHADLSRTCRRAVAWFDDPPDLTAAGRLALAAAGQVGIDGVQIRSANWNCEDLSIAGAGFQFREPHLIGKFTGRVDSGDLSQLIVELLQVQSSSFSLVAQDAAEPDGSRLGRGRFRVDTGRLASSAALDSAIRCKGLMDGNVAWRIQPSACALNLQIDGQDLVVTTVPAVDGEPPTMVWNEPNVQLVAAGVYEFATGAARMDQLSIAVPWSSVEGQLRFTPAPEGTGASETIFQGQLAYDATQLTQKLEPWTGKLIQLTGQHTSPLTVRWRSGSSSAPGPLEGLHVDQLTLGWQSANLAGVEVGAAQVPVRIEAGLLTAAAEIPVSGGAARFDISSDLNAETLTIVQQPQLVLESVQITDKMSASWLKYVAPLVAEATRVDGRLSLRLDEAVVVPGVPQAHRIRGDLTIHQASVGPGPLSNQLFVLYRQIDALRKQQFAQAVAPQQQVWLDLPEQHIQFAMADGQVMHDNLMVRIGDVVLKTTGTVALDGTIAMRAMMPVPDNWIEKSQWLAGLRGQTLEFPVTGTLWQPSIDVRLLADVGRQTIRSAAAGALQQGLQRGLGKLLGEEGLIPMPGATPPADPTAPAPRSNPLKELGDQLLRTPSLFPNILPGSQNPPTGGQ
ncbi:MAG: hypothetical protein D6753_00245 [Planctomycetota bacterium]|nr:MAG: hypothetical protein D6753_00245 [Planctomycetota bacterium]